MARYNVASEDAWVFASNPEKTTEIIVGLPREKGNLSLMTFLGVKEAIAEEPLSRDTFRLWKGDDRMFAGRLPVTSKKVVPRRDVNANDLHL